MFTPKGYLNIQYNKEESNIYKLVDIISSIQKKISFLSKSMEHNKKNELFQKLSLIEDEILKNKKKINNYISKQKKKEINFKKMKYDNELIIKKVDNKLEEINKRLNNIVSGGKNNDKEIYQFSNDNFEKIIEQKKNENKLRDLNIDYNSTVVIYQNLLNILEININKKYQLNEKLNMLEEEKNIIEEKIIENISKKESFEEVSKIYLLKFFNEILLLNLKSLEENKIENFKTNNAIEPSNGAHSLLSNSKNKYLNNNYNNIITNENLKLYFYELSIININDLCNEIAVQLVLSVNSCLKNIYIYSKSLSNSLLQNSENKIKNLDENLKSKIYNSKESNSLISIISSKIKKDILTFMNSVSSSKNENNIFQNSIEEFLMNLSKNIVNYLNYYFSSQLIIKPKEENSIDFHSNILDLSLYLKIIFKKFYLDKIIQNESDFLNNQYDYIEKNFKNFLRLAIANINKLNNKKQDYDKKISEIKHNKQLLQDKFINDKVHPSMKDKAYFDLTKKSNNLIESKRQINNEFNMIENEYEKENQKLYLKILNREKNLKNLVEEKMNIEDKIAKKNKVILNEIEKLKKLMKSKFNLIKNQIEIYKKKYGNNFDLYDRFIEKINKTLRLTSKSLMNKNNIVLNKTFSYNFYSPKNQALPNNFANNTFYKLNNNYNNENRNDSNNKIKNHRPFSKDSTYYNNKNNLYNKLITQKDNSNKYKIDYFTGRI